MHAMSVSQRCFGSTTCIWMQATIGLRVVWVCCSRCGALTIYSFILATAAGSGPAMAVRTRATISASRVGEANACNRDKAFSGRTLPEQASAQNRHSI